MNNTIRNVRIAAATVTIGAITALSAAPAAAETTPGNPDAAVYEGETLDLSESWGGAGACVELTTTTECFDTEAELLVAHPELHTLVAPSKAAGSIRTVAVADCSSSLRLYDGGSYTGTVLYLTTRQLVLNLSSYGFDNVTSSFKVGACATSFFSLANAGGGTFSRSAYTQSASMPSGFNNVLSSVYIN